MRHRLPSLAALRTFEAAARLGSFKLAAEELSVTPTAVSHQIRSLEEQLETPLFIRKTRGITLTEAGNEIAPAITRALDDMAYAIDVATARSNVITLSTTPSFATLFLVPRLVEFYQRFPGYSVQLNTGTGLVDLQQDRHIDLVIRYGDTAARNLVCQPLLDERFGAYVAPGLLSACEQGQSLTLIQTTWQQPVLSNINWEQWLLQSGLTHPQVQQRINRVVGFEEESHVLQAAIAGKGLALASSILVGDYVSRGLLVPFRPEVQLQGQSYRLLHLPGMEHRRKIADFVAWLTEVTGDIGGVAGNNQEQ